MIGPKEKRERALGQSLQLKGKRSSSPKAAIIRKPYRPGQHGKNPVRNLSDFGRQIREKQKIKLSYGLDERNLRQLFERARKMKGSTVVRVLELLERRLDNVVYRLGFAPSRSAARQFVVHGHIRVNGKRVSSPAFVVKNKDLVTVRPESLARNTFREVRELLEKYEAPAWLHVDAAKMEGRVIATPDSVESPFEINLVVESFSK